MSLRCLVTGGAGFIGRFVVAELLAQGHEVLALDDLSNGRRENVRDFESHASFLGLVVGDLKDPRVVDEVFARHAWDVVLHLGASIHVQRSIDVPEPTFKNDVEGTFRILEACRKQYYAINGLRIEDAQFDYDRDVPRLVKRSPRVCVMSTCMVYDLAGGEPISERHAYRPASPYGASKIAADMLAISYHKSYRMPVTVARPFNTYGPFQKSNSEGGVVSIFLKRDLAGDTLDIKGSGEQTRDLLYVEDCARFVVACALDEAAEGEIINAGTGQEIAVRDLARACATDPARVRHVKHDHPQAEIMRLVCDASKAKNLLGWEARVPLAQGLHKTRTWLDQNRWAW